MISEDEARGKILGHVRALPSRTVPLGAGLDCFVQRDLVARVSLPGFDNSSMDGYALIAQFERHHLPDTLAGRDPQAATPGMQGARQALRGDMADRFGRAAIVDSQGVLLVFDPYGRVL